jgi:FMN phosphatase YigB (HAD superfamily)
LRDAGLHLGVASNVDEQSFAATSRLLGGLIDTAVTAEASGAYKPDLAMFEALFDALGAKGIDRRRVLHVAQSRFHDVEPGNAIDLDVVWIDRRFGRPGVGITVDANAVPKARFASLEQFCQAFLPEPSTT